MAIQDIEPDIAIGVKHANVPGKDEKSREAAKKDAANLQLLLETLEKFGFRAQVRAGADRANQLLVFVKIRSSVYQELVKKDLLRNFEFGLTDDDSGTYNKQRLIYEYLCSPKNLGGVGITPGASEWKFVESITSLDAYLTDSNVPEAAKKELWQPSFSTAKFKNLYGPGVALYFDFVRFYTVALAGLAVFGIIGFLKKKNYSIAFSFINMIWGAGVLVLWRRRTKFLANTWGVQNSLELERFRSELASESGQANESKQRVDASKKRFIKQLLFVPVALAFGGVLLTVQGLCFVLEIFILEIYDGPGKSVLTLTPTILLSTFVPVFTIVYNAITARFIDWERHDSNLTRSQSFAIKSFLLNIMTGYVPLLISAFIYLPFAHLLQPNLVYIKRAIAGRVRSDRYAYQYLTNIKSEDSFEINQQRLDSQYFYFIVTNQVIGSVLKFGLPLILTPILNFVQKLLSGSKAKVDVEEDSQEKSWLDEVRRASSLPEYSIDDSFRDIALQFGYVTIFGSIWTLAPLICIIFNILTFKLEEWRLASGLFFKPVVARKIDTIYPWDIAFFFLAWLGSIVSPLVASFYRHGAKPPKKFGLFGFDKASVNVGSTVGLVTVLLLSEHLFFLLCFLGNKVSDLFKSDKEIENDDFQNTINLKKQQYSSREIPNIVAPDDSAWKSFTASSALLQAKNLNVHETVESEAKNRNFEEPAGVLSGVSRAPESEGSSKMTNKKDLLEKKRRELKELEDRKRKELESRAEKGDRIVETVNQEGERASAIMDDNSHVPTTGHDYEKDIDKNVLAGALGAAATGAAGAGAADALKDFNTDNIASSPSDPSAAKNREYIPLEDAKKQLKDPNLSDHTAAPVDSSAGANVAPASGDVKDTENGVPESTGTNSADSNIADADTSVQESGYDHEKGVNEPSDKSTTESTVDEHGKKSKRKRSLKQLLKRT